MAKDPYSFKLPENNLSSTVDKIKYKADALDKIKDVGRKVGEDVQTAKGIIKDEVAKVKKGMDITMGKNPQTEIAGFGKVDTKKLPKDEKAHIKKMDGKDGGGFRLFYKKSSDFELLHSEKVIIKDPGYVRWLRKYGHKNTRKKVKLVS